MLSYLYENSHNLHSKELIGLDHSTMINQLNRYRALKKNFKFRFPIYQKCRYQKCIICEKIIASTKVANDYTKIGVQDITEEILSELVSYAPDKILYQINTQIDFLSQTLQKLKQFENLDHLNDYRSNQLKIDTKILSNMSFFMETIIPKISSIQPIYKLELVYRASQDGLQFEDFTCKISKVQQSIILIKSDQNQIIGGYVPSEIQVDKIIHDSKKQSFIFSDTKREIYSAANDKRKTIDITNQKKKGFYLFEFGKADIKFILPTKDNDGLEHTAHLYSEFPQSYCNDLYKHIPKSNNSSEVKQYLLEKSNSIDYKDRSKIVELEVFKITRY